MERILSLTELLSPWLDCSSYEFSNLEIKELVLDSRQVRYGDTFVAVVGHAIDGRKFINKSIEQGASSVFAQADSKFPHGHIQIVNQIPVVYINGLDKILSELSGQLYSHNTTQLIGITGTNGKTTISQLIAQWVELLGKRAAVMGTTGNGFLDDLKSAKNTTGSAIDIQRTLSELAQAGAQFTALEVSSHGLVQGRVRALSFDVGVFTNLSRDHLDYHGTMYEYSLAKKQLFTAHQCQHAVINVDDSVGQAWVSDLANAVAVSLESKPMVSKSIWASKVSYSENGICLEFDGYWGKGVLHTGLIGQFNASNIVLALASLLSLGFDKKALLEVSDSLIPVIGRMELFQTANKAKVVVDYAHTPDALEKALTALRVHCKGELWAIFGCGGERDKGKRPMMASIGERLADHVILSDDNPRSEDPVMIIEDMLAGLDDRNKASVRHNRYDALEYALNHSRPIDIILLAGKGHEDYQVIGMETIHYSDRESAQTLLGLAK